MVNIGIRHFRPAFGIVQPRISWVLIGTGVESQNTQFRLVSCQCGGRQFGHITVRHANCRSFNLTTQYILITPKTTESLHTTQPDFSFVLPFRASPGCGRQGRARGCDVTPTSRITNSSHWISGDALRVCRWNRTGSLTGFTGRVTWGMKAPRG